MSEVQVPDKAVRKAVVIMEVIISITEKLSALPWDNGKETNTGASPKVNILDYFLPEKVTEALLFRLRFSHQGKFCGIKNLCVKKNMRKLGKNAKFRKRMLYI